MRGSHVCAILLVSITACREPDPAPQPDATPNERTPTPDIARGPACSHDAALAGTTYDVAKSKFAFGDKPSLDTGSHQTRWVGRDGVATIAASGAASATMNKHAAALELPTWNDDPDALEDRVVDYFAGMGIDRCQIAGPEITTSGSGIQAADGAVNMKWDPPTVVLTRAIDGISIAESRASARWVSGDRATAESLYWPTIPANVIRDAFALRDMLRDASQRTSYKALLPDAAQGDATIVIHHNDRPGSAFQAIAVYEVELPNETRAYDTQGKLVPEWTVHSK
jgi:hypothetical protein